MAILPGNLMMFRITAGQPAPSLLGMSPLGECVTQALASALPPLTPKEGHVSSRSDARVVRDIIYLEQTAGRIVVERA